MSQALTHDAVPEGNTLDPTIGPMAEEHSSLGSVRDSQNADLGPPDVAVLGSVPTGQWGTHRRTGASAHTKRLLFSRQIADQHSHVVIRVSRIPDEKPFEAKLRCGLMDSEFMARYPREPQQGAEPGPGGTVAFNRRQTRNHRHRRPSRSRAHRWAPRRPTSAPVCCPNANPVRPRRLDRASPGTPARRTRPRLTGNARHAPPRRRRSPRHRARACGPMRLSR